MKRLQYLWWAVALTTLLATPVLPAVVSNSVQNVTAEDSLAVVFHAFDALGNPAQCDTVGILIVSPSGTTVVAETLTVADDRVSEVQLGQSYTYIFRDQVSNLDGIGAAGCYRVALLAQGAGDTLVTANASWFQVVPRHLSEALAAIGDSSTTARRIWNAPQANHTLAGTFGAYLDANVSGISLGGGAYSVGLLARDTTRGLNLSGVRVTVRAADQSSVVASGITGLDGHLAINLDPGTYVVVATAPGYQFDSYDTVAVAGTSTDTLSANWLDPGEPVLPELCRVYGYLYDLSGQPEEGAQVTVSLSGGVVRSGDAIVAPFAVSTTSDSSGYFAIDVYPSEVLTPSGTRYDIRIARSDGTVLRRRLAVPDQVVWQLVW